MKLLLGVFTFLILFAGESFAGCLCHAVPASQSMCQKAKRCGAPEEELCYKEPGFSWPGCRAAGGSLRPSEQQGCLQGLIDQYCGSAESGSEDQ